MVDSGQFLTTCGVKTAKKSNLRQSIRFRTVCTVCFVTMAIWRGGGGVRVLRTMSGEGSAYMGLLDTSKCCKILNACNFKNFVNSVLKVEFCNFYGHL
jgi:hypothetical protein